MSNEPEGFMVARHPNDIHTNFFDTLEAARLGMADQLWRGGVWKIYAAIEVESSAPVTTEGEGGR